MASAHQIRDLITETTTGTVRPRVPREVRDEVCRYAIRRREKGTPWAVIARETGLDVRKLQRWNTPDRWPRFHHHHHPSLEVTPLSSSSSSKVQLEARRRSIHQLAVEFLPGSSAAICPGRRAHLVRPGRNQTR